MPNDRSLASDARVAVVGLGHVGRATAALLRADVCYDRFDSTFAGTPEEVNGCDLAVLCLPTPPAGDGAADLAALHDVLRWVECPFALVRSTIPPGTTDELRRAYGRHLVHWPEYFGEWSEPVPWERTPQGWPFVMLGGLPDDTRAIVPWLASRLGSGKTYRQAPARTVELAKYMENSWLALQVAFANEFALIAEAVGVDYWELRELWALDPRMSTQHTAVRPWSRGYGGRCLPKDVAALLAAATAAGFDPELLRAMERINHARLIDP